MFNSEANEPESSDMIMVSSTFLIRGIKGELLLVVRSFFYEVKSKVERGARVRTAW